MTQHIEIIGGSRTNRQLRNILDDLQEVVNDVRNFADGMNQIAFDGDFATLAQRLDLRIPEGEQDAGEPDAATAETIYYIVADLNALLNPASPNAVTVALSRMY